MQAHITLLYASLLGVLFLYLSYAITVHRRRDGVDIGSGDSPMLARLIRAQANFAEYVPITLLLMLALENMQPPSALVHGIGTLLLAGRILHAQGFPSRPGKTFGRFWGTLLTWLAILVASLAGIYYTVVSGWVLALSTA
jgi:uncharacterized membrane protein YecN with MAPEG domain